MVPKDNEGRKGVRLQMDRALGRGDPKIDGMTQRVRSWTVVRCNNVNGRGETGAGERLEEPLGSGEGGEQAKACILQLCRVGGIERGVDLDDTIRGREQRGGRRAQVAARRQVTRAPRRMGVDGEHGEGRSLRPRRERAVDHDDVGAPRDREVERGLTRGRDDHVGACVERARGSERFVTDERDVVAGIDDARHAWPRAIGVSDERDATRPRGEEANAGKRDAGAPRSADRRTADGDDRHATPIEGGETERSRDRPRGDGAVGTRERGRERSCPSSRLQRLRHPRAQQHAVTVHNSDLP